MSVSLRIGPLCRIPTSLVRSGDGWRRTVPDRQARNAALIAGIAAGLAYLSGGYVWDDGPLILERLAKLDFGGLVQLWLGPITDSGPGATYYRPMALTVMAGLSLGGPWLFHLAALLLHGGSAALLVHLARGSRWPLLAGLVFAIHPVCSEVLGWASALPDALAVHLGLWATIFWAHPVGVVFLIAGILCKETALLFPLFFGLMGRLESSWWQKWGAVAVLFFILRTVLGVHVPMEAIGKIELAPLAILWPLGALVWPVPLTAVRDVLAAPSYGPWVGGFALLCFLLIGRSKAAWVSVALMVAGPLLALPAVLDGYLAAERYLYPSLVGLGLWMAMVCPRPTRPAWVVFPVVVGLGIHVDRAGDWVDDVSLFGAATEAFPESSYAWHLLGVSQATAGDVSSAAHSFEKAISTGHPHPDDRSLLLRAWVETGRADLALSWAESGEHENLDAATLAWWAKAATLMGDIDRARQILRPLRNGEDWDGPGWVPDLAAELETAAERIPLGTPSEHP